MVIYGRLWIDTPLFLHMVMQAHKTLGVQDNTVATMFMHYNLTNSFNGAGAFMRMAG